MSTKARLRKMLRTPSRMAFDKHYAPIMIKDVFYAIGSHQEMERALWHAWKAGASWQKRQKPTK